MSVQRADAEKDDANELQNLIWKNSISDCSRATRALLADVRLRARKDNSPIDPQHFARAIFGTDLGKLIFQQCSAGNSLVSLTQALLKANSPDSKDTDANVCTPATLNYVREANKLKDAADAPMLMLNHLTETLFLLPYMVTVLGTFGMDAKKIKDFFIQQEQKQDATARLISPKTKAFPVVTTNLDKYCKDMGKKPKAILQLPALTGMWNYDN
jgi:hypothetical protein